ncbi:MAG: homoserine kinase [Nitrospiria bacterium]
MNSVRVFAPASVGNIGPGFDILGMALSGMGDTIIAERRSGPGVFISEITGDEGRLPRAASKNTAGIAVQEVLNYLGLEEAGVSLSLHKDIPGTGLGSSAASAVAGAYAANLLFGKTLSKEALIPMAAVAESKVSGALFLDNVGPSMVGGVTWNNAFTKEIVSLGAIEEAVIVIVTPDFPLLTKEGRNVLPTVVPMSDFVSNMTYASMISWAVARKDLKRFGRSIQDRFAEPARAPLIKGFCDVKEAALSSGALGCSISGAGSTVFAITDDESRGEEIARAMSDGFDAHSVKSHTRVTQMDLEGVRRIV